MKKGFTLIELLAVIVILAIIVLITTPIVMNSIEKSKKGSNERSAENYIRQVELEFAGSIVDDNKIEDGKYTIDNTGRITNGYKTYNINVEGTKPTGGIVYTKNGEVLEGSYFEINGDVINFIEDKAEIKDNYDTNRLGTKVFYNPISSSKCDIEDIANNCYTWYVLEDSGNNYAGINLILDSNINSDGKPIKSKVLNSEGTTAWITETDYINNGGSQENWTMNDGSNEKGPITANNYLKNATSNWNNLASIPSLDQLLIADGQNINNRNNISASWLKGYIDKIDGTANQYNVSGYWVATPSNEEFLAYTVYKSSGEIVDFSVNYEGFCGIRPIINVLKSKIK